MKRGNETVLLTIDIFLGCPPLACLQGFNTWLRRCSSLGLNNLAFSNSSLELSEGVRKKSCTLKKNVNGI